MNSSVDLVTSFEVSLPLQTTCSNRSYYLVSFISININAHLPANEGDDVEYGDFEEKLKGKDIFDGSTLGMAGATADPSVFDPASPMTGTSKYFNGDCNEEELGWCATKMVSSMDICVYTFLVSS